MITFLLVGGIILVVLVLAGLLISGSGERRLVDDRLGKYLEEDEVGNKSKDGKAGSSALSEWVNRSVEGSSFGDRISKSLARADIKFKPGEYIAAIVISTIAVAGIAWFLGNRQAVSALIG